jgi:murein hydrolase activator
MRRGLRSRFNGLSLPLPVRKGVEGRGLRHIAPSFRPSSKTVGERLFLFLILLTLAAAPSKEQATRLQMEAAERARAAEQAAQQQASARAAAAAAEEQRLADQRIAAAAKLRQAEAATEAAATRMDDLQHQRQDAAAELNARAVAMQPLLPVIERLSLYPAETLLAVPATPEDTLRGVLVLQGLARQLQEESAALRRAQADLDTATAAVQAETPKLAAAEATQQQEDAALDKQITAAQADRQAAEADANAAAARAADQAARAETLRTMLVTLDDRRRAEAATARAEAARAIRERHTAEAEAARASEAALSRPAASGTLAVAAAPRGQLIAPVAGTVFRSWGDPTEGGPATGISYRAAPAARVVSPCTGRVVFAAPFRSYGLLMILDCGGGYDAVLAGFDRLDAKIGQDVRPGEPVGVMPGWEPGAGSSRPSLYIELRHDGQPVNPAPWLKSTS